ncbi:MAG: Rnf-Nqr domain containing protein [bacterium]|jgi:electron transport complex protein RnfE
MQEVSRERYFADRSAIIRVVVAIGPTLAITDKASSGLCIGLFTLSALLAAMLVITGVRNFIPAKLRGVLLTLTVVTLTLIAGMLLEVYSPDCFAEVSLLLPLLAVNCLILHRWDLFFAADSVWPQLRQAGISGIIYAAVLVLLGAVREFLGLGTVLGRQVLPAGLLILPPAIFVVFGLLLFALNLLTGKDV